MTATEMQATIDRLTAEVAGLKADAERWQWTLAHVYAAMGVFNFYDTGPPEKIVAAIDEKMAITRRCDAARAALAAQEPTAQEQKT